MLGRTVGQQISGHNNVRLLLGTKELCRTYRNGWVTPSANKQKRRACALARKLARTRLPTRKSNGTELINIPGVQETDERC